MENYIYHIIRQADWQTALEKGYYRAESVDIEGFMHCSTNNQVQGVLERYYANQPNLYKLTIQTDLVLAEIKYELAPSVYELFPHIYGNLNLNAVIAVEEI
jgi:uncharacterized protein (DUF952 family)